MDTQENTLPNEKILQENATEFGKCFVFHFTEKLVFYNGLLRGEGKKDGSIYTALTEKGDASGGLIMGFVSIFQNVPDAIGIGSLLGKLAGMAYQGLKERHYKNKISKLGDLIGEILSNTEELAETLANVSIDIFQCYEMQFTHVFHHNSKNAMYLLAKDAVERAFEQLSRTPSTSIIQSIIDGKSKKKGTCRRRNGYSIDLKFESSSLECRTSDLYEKPGIVTQSKFWKRTDGKSEPSKYGYRLLSCGEKWNSIEIQYEDDKDAKDINKEFAQYGYLLNLGIRVDILKNVIERSKEEGALTGERLKEILQVHQNETNKLFQVVEKSVKDAESRAELRELKKSMSHSDEGGYVTKILDQIQEEMEKRAQQDDKHHKETQGLLGDNEKNRKIAEAADDQNHKTTRDLINENNLKWTTKIEESQELWFGVKPPVGTFTGRKDKMAEIDDAMQKKIETSDKIFELSPIICISGLGGIGKTELARKYASEYRKAFDNNIIWVNAENTTSLRQSFLEFVRVKFPKEREKYEGINNTQNIVQEVYNMLNKRKCLIIFDNVESPSDFKEFRPHLSPEQRTPCILITSQNKEWGMTKVIELEGLTCEEAAGLIRDGLEHGGNSGEEDIKCLADRLQYFPLALQQAVACIKQKNYKKQKYSRSKFDIKDYLEMFDEQTKSLLDFKFPEGSIDNYTKTTFTTLKIMMDKIKDDEDYGRQSEELLNMLSYVYPDNIDMALFKGLDFPNDTLEEVGSLLERYSIIGSKVDCLFNIHRLVQNVVRINLKHERKEEEVLYKAVELFYDHIQHEKENDITWDYERIVHFISLWKYGIQYEEIAKSFSELPRWALYKLVSEGKFSEAVKISKISIEGWKKHAIINENTLHIKDWLTVFPDEPIETIKKIDDALEYHREFLEKLKAKSKNDEMGSEEDYFIKTRDLLVKRKDCIREIKNSGIELYKDDIAIKLYEDFLNECRATLGDNHPLTLDAMTRIADHHKENEEISEATTAYKEVLNKSIEIFGYADLLTYDAMNELAYIFKDNGKIEGAIRIYQDFVNGCKDTLGIDHERVLSVNIKIANHLERIKKFDQAITVYEELLNRRLNYGCAQKVLGNMAKLHNKLGSKDKANKAFQCMERIRRNKPEDFNASEVIGRLY